MIRQCPTCGHKGLIRVRDVRYLPKRQITLRTHVCTCGKVILTKEEIINADRSNANLR
jgi:DNA-directed RNA polymerase subunit RPC12/RpoP